MRKCLYMTGYERPLLQAWLLPDLNTIANNCVRENSLWLSGYGIGFSSMAGIAGSNPVQILYFCLVHVFIHLFLC